MVYPTNGDQNRVMDVLDAIGPALAGLRSRLKLTQAAVAESADLGQPDLSRVESGKQGISLPSLVNVAKAMGVHPSDVLMEAERIAGQRATSSQPELMVEDPGKAAARIANDIDALRYAVGAICATIAATRPAEGDQIAEALRHAPKKFHEKEGAIRALLKALESASHQAKERARAQHAAAPESRGRS